MNNKPLIIAVAMLLSLADIASAQQRRPQQPLRAIPPPPPYQYKVLPGPPLPPYHGVQPRAQPRSQPPAQQFGVQPPGQQFRQNPNANRPPGINLGNRYGGQATVRGPGGVTIPQTLNRYITTSPRNANMGRVTRSHWLGRREVPHYRGAVWAGAVLVTAAVGVMYYNMNDDQIMLFDADGEPYDVEEFIRTEVMDDDDE